MSVISRAASESCRALDVIAGDGSWNASQFVGIWILDISFDALASLSVGIESCIWRALRYANSVDENGVGSSADASSSSRSISNTNGISWASVGEVRTTSGASRNVSWSAIESVLTVWSASWDESVVANAISVNLVCSRRSVASAN